VNFCKFTNETRNGLEDSSAHSGLKFLAAVNGACAGGGYELALACDEIILVDDRSSAVSLPEVPLLGVLPGTGGLTRVTDKRHVRHDLADIFCTTSEGVRGQKAKDWRLVDDIAKPAVFAAKVQERALQLAAQSDRPADAKGVALTPLHRSVEADALRYATSRWRSTAPSAPPPSPSGPAGAQPTDVAGIEAAGAAWYPLRWRANWKTPSCRCAPTNWTSAPGSSRPGRRRRRAGDGRHAAGAPEATGWCARPSACCAAPSAAWTCSRSLFALIEPGSCFAGTLLELALACDRSYHADAARRRRRARRRSWWTTNFGRLPDGHRPEPPGSAASTTKPALDAVRAKIGQPLDADAAFALGLVTSNPDDIDWADEVRIAIEERVAMSPDALTGLEANLRFNGPENMFTRVFGRLTAWQNWIFQRPNAVGEKGA
jgi:benzoyl-CoA-dihydrodiol lyase